MNADIQSFAFVMIIAGAPELRHASGTSVLRPTEVRIFDTPGVLNMFNKFDRRAEIQTKSKTVHV